MSGELVNEQGIVARYFAAAQPIGVGTIIFDGAGGGFPTDESVPQALAAAGHPTLAVAYFRNRKGEPPELPVSLKRIPVEYALSCLAVMTTLSRLPADRIVLMGQSRGAEFALLAASRCSALAGVVAFSPSDGLWQASTFERKRAPAWTEADTDLPFRSFKYFPGRWKPGLPLASAYVGDVKGTEICVERIPCPVLLVSSDDDRIWPSSRMAEAITARMLEAGREVRHLRFADASHVLMGFGDAPVRVRSLFFTMKLGGTEQNTRLARDAAWGEVLSFLRERSG